MKLSKAVKKGVSVVVKAGAHKGQSGLVLSYDRAKDLVLVEGVNMKKVATKKTQKTPAGGIVSREAPIHLSNLGLSLE